MMPFGVRPVFMDDEPVQVVGCVSVFSFFHRVCNLVDYYCYYYCG